MIQRILFCFLFVFMTALPFAFCEEGPSKKGAQRTETMRRIPAPELSLQDLTGKTFDLSRYRGKTVLLNFTTTWCPYCIKDIPGLKKIHERFKNRDFLLVSIYIQESRKKVSSFAEKHGLAYTTLIDPDGKTAMRYGVRGVPTKVIVGEDGNIVCWMCSDVEGELEKKLRKR